MVPVAVIMRVPAMPAIAIPKAPRLGRLRCRNTGEERDRRKGAKNEPHRITSCSNSVEVNAAAGRKLPIRADFAEVESPLHRDCFASLATTAKDCHCEERSDAAISIRIMQFHRNSF